MSETAHAPLAVVESRHVLPGEYADPARVAMEFEVRDRGAHDFPIELTA